MTDANRRAVLAFLLPATLAACSTINPRPALAAPLVDEATHTWLRLVADLSGKTKLTVTRGTVWGFKPQADDLTTSDFAKRLYGYWSLVARQALPTEDGGIALTTKAWTFYLDAESGAVISQLINPYTGQRVDCPPLSGGATVPYGPGATPASPLDLRVRRLGQQAWVDVTRISRFKPGDIDWFKLEADMTSYACRASDLDDKARSTIPSTWSHTLVAEWQTWMKMHGAPGHILFRGDGAAIESSADVPEDLRAALDQHFPLQLGLVDGWKKP